MTTEFITLNPNKNESPVYMSREQFEDAYYIPNDRKIIIVNKEEDNNDNS